MAEVIVAGHICLDIIPKLVGGAQLVPGRSIEAGPLTLATGGAVANTGLSLRRLGVDVRLAGIVGDDLIGRTIREIVESHAPGLSAGLRVAGEAHSSYTVVVSPPGVDRMFMHAPGCNATFGAADVGGAELAAARLLHFGYPQTMARMYAGGGAELETLMRRAKDAGAGTSLDMTIPDPQGAAARVDWRAVLAQVLPFVDVFLPGLAELLIATDRPRLDALLAEARERGCDVLDLATPELLRELAGDMLKSGAAIAVIKLGHRGMYMRTASAERLARMGRAAPASLEAWAERELWAPAFEVEVAGTTGAGDAAIAGLLMALLRGFSPDDALTAACAVGACCVEAPDALSGVRPWPETQARVAGGWARRS